MQVKKWSGGQGKTERWVQQECSPWGNEPDVPHTPPQPFLSCWGKCLPVWGSLDFGACPLLGSKDLYVHSYWAGTNVYLYMRLSSHLSSKELRAAHNNFTTTIWGNTDSEGVTSPRSITEFHGGCGGSMPASQQRSEGAHPAPTEAEQWDRASLPAEEVEAAPIGRKAEMADVHVAGQAQKAARHRNIAKGSWALAKHWTVLDCWAVAYQPQAASPWVWLWGRGNGKGKGIKKGRGCPILGSSGRTLQDKRWMVAKLQDSRKTEGDRETEILPGVLRKKLQVREKVSPLVSSSGSEWVMLICQNPLMYKEGWNKSLHFRGKCLFLYDWSPFWNSTTARGCLCSVGIWILISTFLVQHSNRYTNRKQVPPVLAVHTVHIVGLHSYGAKPKIYRYSFRFDHVTWTCACWVWAP